MCDLDSDGDDFISDISVFYAASIALISLVLGLVVLKTC